VSLPGGRPQRISIVGSTGTGKTTYARRLAEVLGVPHTELDAIAWQPAWTILPREEFRARVGRGSSAYS
jgi:adenylate kinase family enzyme